MLVAANMLIKQTNRFVSVIRQFGQAWQQGARVTSMVGGVPCPFVPVRRITDWQIEERWDKEQKRVRTRNPKKLFANTATVLESLVKKSGQLSEQPDPQTLRRIKVSLEALSRRFGLIN